MTYILSYLLMVFVTYLILDASKKFTNTHSTLASIIWPLTWCLVIYWFFKGVFGKIR